MKIKPGTKIGRYEIKEELGRGGMGSVFLAYDQHLRANRALKFISVVGTNTEVITERFLREAQAAAQLGTHRNIVTVHDHIEGENGEPDYTVLEYVPGKSLDKVLKSESPLAVHRALELFRGICAGVAAAHHNRCVHRDLDPKNVIISVEGGVEIPKVCDWGLVKIPDARVGESRTAITHSNCAMGKLPYLAPEDSATAGPPSDVYSLGIVLYEMLSGERPFNGPSEADYFKQHREIPPPPFRRDLDIPKEIEVLVMRALAKNPSQRQTDASVLLEELTKVQDELSEGKRRAEEEERGRKEEMVRQSANLKVERAEREAANERLVAKNARFELQEAQKSQRVSESKVEHLRLEIEKLKSASLGSKTSSEQFMTVQLSAISGEHLFSLGKSDVAVLAAILLFIVIGFGAFAIYQENVRTNIGAQLQKKSKELQQVENSLAGLTKKVQETERQLDMEHNKAVAAEGKVDGQDVWWAVRISNDTQGPVQYEFFNGNSWESVIAPGGYICSLRSKNEYPRLRFKLDDGRQKEYKITAEGVIGRVPSASDYERSPIHTFQTTGDGAWDLYFTASAKY